MKHTKDNKLVLVNIKNDDVIRKEYFTSYSAAGLYLGIASQSVKWAINHHNELINNRDEKITIELIDGSEIPYKYIKG